MSQNKTLRESFKEHFKIGIKPTSEEDVVKAEIIEHFHNNQFLDSFTDFFVSKMRERIAELDGINREGTGWNDRQAAYNKALDDLLEYLK